MIKYFLSILFITVLYTANNTVSAQNSDILKVCIADATSNNPVVAASIVIEKKNKGITSDDDGCFVMPKLSDGRYTLHVSSMGYHRKTIVITIPDNAQDTLSISLKPKTILLDDIMVVSSVLRTGNNYQPQKTYNRDEIFRRSDISAGQMLDGEPGIAMRSFGSVPSRPVIRGFDGERLLILENGERMGDLSESAVDHAIALDPAAMETIEVIRGPAGLLFGNSAIGGVVNMVTSDIPRSVKSGLSGNTSLMGASMNGLTGAYGRLNYGAGNNALTSRFSFRNAGDITTPDGRLPGTGMAGMEGSLGWGYHINQTQMGFALMGMKNTYGIPEGIDSPDDEVEIRFSRQALQGQLHHSRNGFFNTIQMRMHLSQYAHQEVEIEFLPNGSIDEDIEIDYHQRAFSTTISGYHRGLAGSGESTIGINLNGRVMDLGGDEAYAPGDWYINPAVFTLQEIALNANTKLQIGIRLDYRYIQTRTNHLFPDINENSSDLDISAAIGLQFSPGNASLFGIQFARSHRYPTTEELFSDGAHIGAGAYEIGDPDLKTERTFGIDAFYRWNLQGVEVEAAGFYSYIQNFIAFQPQGYNHEQSGLPVFNYIGDNAVLAGAELSFAARFSDGLSADIILDYVHGTQLNQSKDPLPFMPPLRSRVAVHYDRGQMFFSGNVRLVSRQNRTAPQEEVTNGYILAGLQAGYRIDNRGLHNIMLRADNLFDTKYRDHLSRVEDRQFPMPGRNIMLVYGWTF